MSYFAFVTLFESKTHSGVANQFVMRSMSLIQFGFVKQTTFVNYSEFAFLMPLHFAFVMDSGFATPLAFAST